MERKGGNEEMEEGKAMSKVEDQSPVTTMRFKPLNELGDGKKSMKLSHEWRALTTRWAERVVKLPPEDSPKKLLPEFLEENPNKQWEGEFMLTSMGTVREIWGRQQSAATCPVDDPPSESGNEVRVKAYLTSLQAQDISPVASEEDSAEPKLCLEDIDEVVNKEWIIAAGTPLAFEEDVIYAGGEFNDEI